MSDDPRPIPGFRVGPVHVNPPVLLAPMEDVTGLPFRRICKQIAGPGLMFTEFVSAMAIHYGAKKTIKKLRIDTCERPLGIQIFGGEPDTMAETARLAEEMGADIVDINMGCWVPKVCKTGAGASLLKDPDLATRIVSKVVDSVKVPVTVKVRAGWDYSLFAAPDLTRRFQDAGVQMITLHARFAKQGFDGEANWKLIASLREALNIPLIGNGDIKTGEDAMRMFRETGCDGVMVGRAAISNPWTLRSIVDHVRGVPTRGNPTLNERIEVALQHARDQIQFEIESGDFTDDLAAEIGAIRSLRGLIPLYIKGEYGAAHIRSRLTSCSTYNEIEDILLTFAKENRNYPPLAPTGS